MSAPFLIRLGTIVLAAAMLCGCDDMITTTPLLAPADASPGLVLKPGLWVMPPCTAPSEEPPCKPVRVDANTVAGFVPPDPKLSESDRAMVAAPLTYILADGRPPVMQLRFPNLGPSSPEAQGGGDANSPIFAFLAVSPVEHDASGRIIRAKAWLVLCGEPMNASSYRKAAADGPAGGLPPPTLHPFPGVELGGLTCSAKDRDALHRAARLSERYGKPVMEFFWVGPQTEPKKAP
jgi:hypothetical protein